MESVIGYNEYNEECNKLALNERLGIPFFIEGDKMHEWYGPHCSNYHIWLRKIKETFDPDNVSDPGCYITSKKSKNK